MKCAYHRKKKEHCPQSCPKRALEDASALPLAEAPPPPLPAASNDTTLTQLLGVASVAVATELPQVLGASDSGMVETLLPIPAAAAPMPAPLLSAMAAEQGGRRGVPHVTCAVSLL